MVAERMESICERFNRGLQVFLWSSEFCFYDPAGCSNCYCCRQGHLVTWSMCCWLASVVPCPTTPTTTTMCGLVMLLCLCRTRWDSSTSTATRHSPMLSAVKYSEQLPMLLPLELIAPSKFQLGINRTRSTARISSVSSSTNLWTSLDVFKAPHFWQSHSQVLGQNHWIFKDKPGNSVDRIQFSALTAAAKLLLQWIFALFAIMSAFAA